MFDLFKMFESKTAKKDKIAELLRTDKELLEKFEQAYSKAPIDDGYMNAKDMAYMKGHSLPVPQEMTGLKEKIVDELLHGTKVFKYTRKSSSTALSVINKQLPSTLVTNHELAMYPIELRPELTGNMMKKDVPGNSYEALLDNYISMNEAKDPKTKKQFYHMFRQGLDILDVDPVVYEMLSCNKNSMGNWLPAMIPAVEKEGFFSIPDTTIVKVPITMLQLTRLDYMDHNRITLDIVDEWAQAAFGLEADKHYFIKTGTYSSKFDFRNAKITDPKEVMEIGEYLLFIHTQAVSMAHHDLTGRRPVMYGVSTTNEWVVREFIEDEDDEKLTIYHGLPLHTEYRVFVDFDTDEVLGIHPYWDPEVMKQRFGHAEDSDDPDMVHDYITYSAQEEKLMSRYNANKDAVVEHVKKFLPDVELSGQWSIDIMQNGDKFWFIDMALAENSAFYDETVPVDKRIPTEENWIPMIPELNK